MQQAVVLEAAATEQLVERIDQLLSRSQLRVVTIDVESRVDRARFAFVARLTQLHVPARRQPRHMHEHFKEERCGFCIYFSFIFSILVDFEKTRAMEWKIKSGGLFGLAFGSGFPSNNKRNRMCRCRK